MYNMQKMKNRYIFEMIDVDDPPAPKKIPAPKQIRSSILLKMNFMLLIPKTWILKL
jgi:hypothetical protein